MAIHHATLKKAEQNNMTIEEKGGLFYVRDADGNLWGREATAKEALGNALLSQSTGGEPIPEVQKMHINKDYRAKYAVNEDRCGDDLSELLKAHVSVPSPDKPSRDMMDIVRLIQVGTDNGVDVEDRWGHLNNGQIRMNLGNVLRGMWRRGQTIKIGEYTLEPEVKDQEDDTDDL